jgi:hypothetical protein
MINNQIERRWKQMKIKIFEYKQPVLLEQAVNKFSENEAIEVINIKTHVTEEKEYIAIVVFKNR